MPTSCTATYLFVMYFFETLFSAFSLIQALLFLFILLKVRLIHVHLRVAIITLCVATIARGIPRTINLCDLVFCGKILSLGVFRFFTWLSSGFNFTIMVMEIIVIAERTLSHIMTRKYEKFRSIWISLLVSVGPIVLGLGITFNTIYLNTIPLMPINYAMMGVNVFSGISFYAVVQYYKYRESQAFWTKTLSERYQQAENIRTNKTMFWWCVFSVIHRMLAGAVQIYRGFVRANENSTPDDFAFTESLLHMTYAVMMNFFPFVFILTLPSLRRKYRETFPYLASIFELGSARVAPPHVQEVQTIQAHFNNLVNTWNVDFNKKNVNRNEKR